MKRVLILGGTGMLGSMLLDVFSREDGIEVVASSRSIASATAYRSAIGVEWVHIDAQDPDIRGAFDRLPRVDWVINAIGITKPLVRDNNAFEVERAIRVNSIMPHSLADWAQGQGSRVLQIATDCVWSGRKGMYIEEDVHDALDVYGKTKSLGEAYSPAVNHLRCSIIGPEPKDFKFLIEWFRRQPQGASVKGFTDHQWNGLTTLHFARICLGIVRNELALGHLAHVVPTGTISKADMLACFARVFARGDIDLQRADSGKPVDRTLKTSDLARNARLWSAAGYSTIPDVTQQLEELAAFDYRFASRETARLA